MASVYTRTKKSFYTETLFNTCADNKLLHTANFYTQHLLHTASFHTQQAFRHRTLTTQYLHTVLLHMASVYTNFSNTGIAASKPDLDAKAEKRRFWSIFKWDFKRKITSAKIAKICWQMTIAAWMQPLQYDLQSSAAKDNSITHAPRRQATLRQPLQCDLQRLSCKSQ